ncbi:transmembrane protein 119 [Echinops telfairi]|uniref:Transmembrane protein 119 n=4 Tax=Echinops telfairi TaxID=9371 RepID=A0AC55DM06_ECHTE|nr:transmembrane protein 119 [Echinops telfairi]XP_045152778.1 transmembrane protein 119 [Echinops telfairi]XP_045152779.1 transmembrane protein 119 [Echinops telfairi]XP_045152780.1 transmembrane protein 119 [Echinops telfairi]
MERLAAPTLISLLLLLLAAAASGAPSVGLQASFLEDAGGSGEAEGSSASSPSLPPAGMPAFSATSVGPPPTVQAGPQSPPNFLDGILDFFQHYVLLVAVVGSLTLLLVCVTCAALITRQKHKASAYYPSSFPKKKYVDQSDRAGGPRAFSEVPDRAPEGRPDEALVSSQQLQADILAATQNLKSPVKATPGAGDGAVVVELKAQEEAEEAEQGEGGQEADKEAQAPGVPAECPDVPGVPCAAGAQEGLAVGEGQGEPDALPLLSQEAGDPTGSPESPCA